MSRKESFIRVGDRCKSKHLGPNCRGDNARAYLREAFCSSALRFEGASSLEPAEEEDRSLLKLRNGSLGALFLAALEGSCRGRGGRHPGTAQAA